MRDLSSRLSAVLSASYLAAVVVCHSLFPLSAFAAEKAVPFHGQPAAIFVDGDPMQVAVGDPATDGELILVFTNAAAAANTLRSTLPLSMRVLIVGGGGSGGYGVTGTGTNPGGGDGGGEVIELGNKGTRRGKSAPFLFIWENFVSSWIVV